MERWDWGDLKVEVYFYFLIVFIKYYVLLLIVLKVYCQPNFV